MSGASRPGPSFAALAAGAILAVVIPGALVVAGMVAAWRYVFGRRDDVLTAETLRRVRRDAEMAARVRELDETPRGRRTVLDGPAPTRAHSRPWGSR